MPYKESLSYDNNTLHPSKSTASLVLSCPLLVTLLQHQSVCKAPVSLTTLEQDPEIFKLLCLGEQLIPDLEWTPIHFLLRKPNF